MASSVKTSSWTKEIRERNKIGDEEKFMQQYGYLCKHKMTQSMTFLAKTAII